MERGCVYYVIKKAIRAQRFSVKYIETLELIK